MNFFLFYININDQGSCVSLYHTLDHFHTLTLIRITDIITQRERIKKVTLLRAISSCVQYCIVSITWAVAAHTL